MSPLQKLVLGGVLLLGLFLMVKPYMGPSSPYEAQAPSEYDRKLADQNLSATVNSESPSASIATTVALTKSEALARIQGAGHTCSEVTSVNSAGDSASATCSDGERYRLAEMIIDGKSTPVAMKCSAVEALGIAGC